MAGKVLIVDDMATNRIVYKVKLNAAFYQTVLLADGRQCVDVARQERPDLVMLDQMPPGYSAAAVILDLQKDPLTRRIPVVVIAPAADSAARLAAFKAGAADVLDRPVRDALLTARIRNLIRSRQELDDAMGVALVPDQLAEAAEPFHAPGAIAVIAQSAGETDDWRVRVALAGGGNLFALDPDQLLSPQGRGDGVPQMPDVVVLDCAMPDDQSLRLLSELKSSPVLRHSAICLRRKADRVDCAALAFDLGADDVLSTSMPDAEAVQRLSRLVREKRRGDQQRASVEGRLREALIDPLTGLYNRRYALPQLGQIAEQSALSGHSFAAFVIDIDRFKSVNDAHGHAAGDAVLVEVAARLKSNLRTGDLLARIGGEEFLAVLPDVGLNDAHLIAGRLCKAIHDRTIATGTGSDLAISVSIGLAMGAGPSRSANEDVIGRADLALLDAKRAGRNRVTISQTAA